MHSSPSIAGNLAQKFCVLKNSDAVLYHLFSLHLTIQIVLEEELLQTQCLKFILKQEQGKVFCHVLLRCVTKLHDLHEMKIT